MVRLIHQKGERHLEDVGDFRRIGFDIEWRRDQRHDRPDQITGAGAVGIEITERFDARRIERNFFIGLADGSGRRIAITGIDAATRKRDLTGVRRQMRGAFGKEHSQRCGCANRNQYRSVLKQYAVGHLKVGVEVEIARWLKRAVIRRRIVEQTRRCKAAQRGGVDVVVIGKSERHGAAVARLFCP